MAEYMSFRMIFGKKNLEKEIARKGLQLHTKFRYFSNRKFFMAKKAIFGQKNLEDDFPYLLNFRIFFFKRNFAKKNKIFSRKIGKIRIVTKKEHRM